MVFSMPATRSTVEVDDPDSKSMATEVRQSETYTFCLCMEGSLFMMLIVSHDHSLRIFARRNGLRRVHGRPTVDGMKQHILRAFLFTGNSLRCRKERPFSLALAAVYRCFTSNAYDGEQIPLFRCLDMIMLLLAADMHIDQWICTARYELFG